MVLVDRDVVGVGQAVAGPALSLVVSAQRSGSLGLLLYMLLVAMAHRVRTRQGLETGMVVAEAAFSAVRLEHLVLLGL